ncbi:alpha/beta hydrolase [Sphingobacterium sp. HJSM2_6]|uniref:alpha/beta hydrolase n=1 Tax=Sphingobacterium sp. HJSM2_6 TaxID=3366264 RepID=UPI003BDF1A5B
MKSTFPYLLYFFLGCLSIVNSHAQEVVPVYIGEVPNSKKSDLAEFKKPDDLVGELTLQVKEPKMLIFKPQAAKNNHTAIIICPGGGYHVLLTEREGSAVAKKLAEEGYTALVLHYRLPNEQYTVNQSIAPLQDIQMAIKRTRELAKSGKINSSRVGVMGFSAGGHLALMGAVHDQHPAIENQEQTSLKVDFAILVNPVASFETGIGHEGSKKNLLGKFESEETIAFFSGEKQINAATAPMFLVHALDDVVVPVENSLRVFDQLRIHKVPVELHVYSKGEHGFLTAPSFDEWFNRCLNWLQSMHYNQQTI